MDTQRTLYEIIEEDIRTTLPDEVTDLIPPYLEHMTFDERFQTTYISLQRATRLKSRILALTNAYFLGKLLNSLDPSQRYIYHRMIATHYQVMAENTYDIFECQPRQIARTLLTTVQHLRKLPRPEVLTLRNTLIEIFAGAQNLGAEDC